MKIIMRDTDLIFRDLSDAFKDLQEKRTSPVEIRRAFARFLTLSQQLTETMRKEFKRLTGEDWVASDFKQWNATTKLFKKLRRSDYHEFPVTINVRELQFYPATQFYDSVDDDGHLIFTAVWGLGDPFVETVPKAMTISIEDECSNGITTTDIQPEKVEYEFILHPRTDEIRNAIDETGTDDIHLLSEQCFTVLRDYYNYYLKKIND